MDNIRSQSFDFEGQPGAFDELISDRASVIDPGQISANDHIDSNLGIISPILDTEINAISLDELDYHDCFSEDIFGVGTSEESLLSTSYPLNYLETGIDPLTGRREAIGLDLFDEEEPEYQDNQENIIFNQALSEAFSALVKLSCGDNVSDIFRESFGQDLAPEMIKDAIASLINAEAEIEFTVISQGKLGANGGFASESNTVYLAQEFLEQNAANSEVVVKLLLEEIGHYFDSQFNEEDSPGDEGAIFAAFVLGEELDDSRLERLKAEDDSAVVTVDGETFAIEQADEPDLKVTKVEIPEDILIAPGEELPITWRVTNNGEVTARSGW
ncbi:MAG: hypothetical protein AAGA80_14740, partial [Cyanobacteria bacterium P01_F01_bin.143]